MVVGSLSTHPGRWVIPSLVATTAAAGAIVSVALLCPPTTPAIVGLVALTALALLATALLATATSRLYP